MLTIHADIAARIDHAEGGALCAQAFGGPIDRMTFGDASQIDP